MGQTEHRAHSLLSHAKLEPSTSRVDKRGQLSKELFAISIEEAIEAVKKVLSGDDLKESAIEVPVPRKVITAVKPNRKGKKPTRPGYRSSRETFGHRAGRFNYTAVDTPVVTTAKQPTEYSKPKPLVTPPASATTKAGDNPVYLKTVAPLRRPANLDPFATSTRTKPKEKLSLSFAAGEPISGHRRTESNQPINWSLFWVVMLSLYAAVFTYGFFNGHIG